MLHGASFVARRSPFHNPAASGSIALPFMIHPGSPLRLLPSVEKLVLSADSACLPRPLLVFLARRHLARWREILSQTPEIPAPEIASDRIVTEFLEWIATTERSRLRPVINGTGILIHTNLGRAPLSSPAAEAVSAVAQGYCNLEFDLDTGERGSRGAYLELALAQLFGAEHATVVNNCAAALVLVLHHFCRGDRREVVLSRGELVQIGGGFRIPEILETAGARLREVGTTNQTSLDDYRAALGPATALVLKVHRSNFVMEGFVDSPRTEALAALTREHSVPFVEDLGSGAAVDLASAVGLPPEPRPNDVLAQGADLVCFSGDKLLGGPQAGIIAGKSDHVSALRRNPLFRALRCDKLVFAGLQATVESYLHAAARRDHGVPIEIPILAAMTAPVSELRRRADVIRDALGHGPWDIDVRDSEALVGGGVSPRAILPSVSLAFRPRRETADQLATCLRRQSPPVIGRVERDVVRLDLRTIRPDEDAELIRMLLGIGG